MKFRTMLFAATMAGAVSGAAQANEFEPALRDFAAKQVRVWIADAKVVAAIKAQNKETGAYSEEKIVSLDKQWRSETSQDARPLIDSVLKRGISDYLRSKKDETQGMVTEIFVMDAKGLNVGQSDVTRLSVGFTVFSTVLAVTASPDHAANMAISFSLVATNRV